MEPSATLYTDELPAYQEMPEFEHEAVKHSVGEYVREQAHTNGLESFWSMLKRGYHGTYHRMSTKHLGRYAQEFAGRHNIRDLDTLEQTNPGYGGESSCGIGTWSARTRNIQRFKGTTYSTRLSAS